jgi:mitogen-activated protein kinase 1/3
MMPNTFKTIKKLGKGAYGKVMEVMHVETQQKFAVKRFEEIFSKELRAKRLLRELCILRNVKHPCLNKLKSVIPPLDYNNFNDAYLVLDLCDMDMKKLLKSSKHLEET